MTEIIARCYVHKKTEHVKELEISRGLLTITFDCGSISKIFFEE